MPHALRIAAVLFLTSSLLQPALLAQEPAAVNDAKAPPSQEELNKRLQAELTNVKLIGSFTVSGKEDQRPKAEEYTITRAIKVPDEPDVWLLTARIKYGDKDATVPIPLEIKWAGDTPVITLTNLEIPGLGTFTSRVVLYEGRYAGTWQHGDVGGHLFGRIEKLKEAAP